MFEIKTITGRKQEIERQGDRKSNQIAGKPIRK